MQRKKVRRIGQVVAAGLLAWLAVWVLLPNDYRASLAQDAPAAPTDFDAPTYSSPIAMSADKFHIWVVNPDNDSVSIISNLNGTPEVINTIRVGREPQGIAIGTNDVDPSRYRVFVANAADNGITIINATNSSATSVSAAVEVPLLVTGAEPWNVVVSPDGQRVFVANSGQDTITVIRNDTTPPSIVGNITLRDSACNVGDPNRHFQPRGMAVTLDNTRLYVTRFLSFTKDGGVQANDTGKEGLVCLIEIPAALDDLPTVFTPITLGAQPTGFNIDSTGDGVPDPTSAFPNQLQSIVIHGNQAYLPNIAASPSGPLRFNVDTQAFVNVIDNAVTGTPVDASATKFLNLHLGARDPEAGKDRLFFANVWAIAFDNPSDAGNAYVVSSGSDLLVKLQVNDAGKLDFTGDISTTTYINLNDRDIPEIAGENAGKNPLGIVVRNIAPNNNFAYVMNYVSRNVSVVDLDNDVVAQVIPLTALPKDPTNNPGDPTEEQLQIGKEMFFSSRGDFVTPEGTTVSTVNRLSAAGWQSCSSCHFAGLTDGTIWTFGAGPRKSVPLNATWSPHNPDDQRVLNYSAIFDEVEDFEANVRNVSGPGNLAAPIAGSLLNPNQGLIISDTGNINFAPLAVPSLIPIKNAGRQEVKAVVAGSTNEFAALTALRQWIRFAVRTPNGALTVDELDVPGGNTDGGIPDADVTQGRRLFFRAGCHTCHGGTKWTVSTKDFASPPAATEVSVETGPPNNPAGVIGTQFLNRFLKDVDSFNLGVAGGPNEFGDNIGGVEKASGGATALGADHNGDGKGDGFNIPALLGIWAVQPYFHNGACETLECVLSDENHRTAGLRQGQNDPLTSAANQERLVAFLQTLDAETDFPLNLSINAHDIFLDPPVVFSGQQGIVIGANVSLFGTRADLQNVLDDLAVSALTVRFTVPGANGNVELDATLAADDFPQDFGQAVVTKTFAIPAITGIRQLKVEVDTGLQLAETNENDNVATRNIRVRQPPQDRTPPVVNGTFISDDEPFNDSDPITQQGNVRIKIKATDPAGQGPVSGPASFCIVRYTFNAAIRRWVPQTCTFQPLPPLETGTTDTFIVSTPLEPFAGVAYAFVWVRDAAGNISRVPGFDFINFIPNTPINLNRNDIRFFRIPLGDGQQVEVTFTPEFGDVDVQVFEPFNNPATTVRTAVSANNGTTPEQVTITGPGRFQVEVRAIVNSRFTITVVTAAAAGPAQTTNVSESGLDSILVSGPPALHTAIEAPEPEELYLPAVTK